MPGDIEPDGDIDLTDFAAFARTWLAADGEGAYNPVCDIDPAADGTIDILDLRVFVENWLAGR